MKGRNAALDLLKVLAAHTVVFLHTYYMFSQRTVGLEYGVKNIIYTLTISINPVEIFMITTSYFLNKKIYSAALSDRRKIIYTSIKRLVVLYLFWSIPWIVNLLLKWDLKDMIQAVLFTGSTGAFWYILAMIYGLALFGILQRFGEKYIWLISVLLYVFNLVADPYYNVFSNITILNTAVDVYNKVFVQIYLCRAPLFIAIGMLVAKHDNEIKRISEMPKVRKAHLLLVVMFSALKLLEVGVISRYNLGLSSSTAILTPVTATLLWTFVYYNTTITIRNEHLAKIIQNASSVYYLAHVLFVTVINKGFTFLGMNLSAPLMFIFTLFGCFILTLIVTFLQKRWGWIKKVV